jgi:hypothetical protein
MVALEMDTVPSEDHCRAPRTDIGATSNKSERALVDRGGKPLSFSSESGSPISSHSWKVLRHRSSNHHTRSTVQRIREVASVITQNRPLVIT